MVNVPGRSKGCKNCRTRKIRCSLERPECSHCTKSGRSCPGYIRERIFVHSDLATEAEKNRQCFKDKPIKRIDTRFERERHPDSNQLWPQEDSSSESVSSLTDSSSSRALISTSLRQQMLVTYFAQYHSISPTTASTRDGCAWISISIPSTPSPHKALETTAYALSLARFGTIMHRQDMVRESLNLYTQGLHRIQKALWDPELMYSDETLGACMLLAMYEAFECPNNSRTAYLSHLEGCAKLIQSRGPAAHIDGLAHSIFEWFRFTGTIGSLQTKQTFLYEEEWKTLPFSKLPKTPFQRVLDLLLEAPFIQRRADQLPNLPPEKHIPLVVDLIHECLAVDDGMQKLYVDLESSQGSPVYWCIPSSLPGSAGDLFPTSYAFPNSRTGMTMMLSWATLTILWSGMCHLYRYIGHLTTLTPTTEGTLTGTYTVDGEIQDFEIPLSSRYKEFPAMARNVCQSVEFCMQDELGIASLTCPLAMVVEALGSWPGFEREITWAKDMLGSVQKKGMKIAIYTL